MKLTAIILFAACLHLSATTSGQNVTLSVKNATMREVFREIQKQTGLNVIMNEKILKDVGRVTLHVNNMPVADVLNLCFINSPVGYTIVNGTIVVKSRSEIQKDISSFITTEPIPLFAISGRITDEDGNPLVGASIKVKGTLLGAQTNPRGEFFIQGVDENAVLIISFIGYETREISVASYPGLKLEEGKSGPSITLRVDVRRLNEVIVNKGYYTEQQKFSTGNVATVTAREIEKQPVTNPLQALQGRVPGLFITQQTGITGGNIDVQIRGKNSILNGNDPLYIVDGVPFPSQFAPNAGYITTSLTIGSNSIPSPLNYLNPADIESIDILKDADATAIYGSRGANGVILITTKKGKVGTTNVDINFYKGFSEVSHMQKLMNSQQYLQYRREALLNDGLTPSSTDYDLNGAWNQNNYTDWQKVLIGGHGQFTDAQAAVSGGTTMTQYFVNGGYHKETTVFPKDYGFTKGSLHFSLTSYSANQKFKMQLSGSYVATENRLPYTDLAANTKMYPLAPKVYDSVGNLNWENSTWTNPYSYFEVSSKAFEKNLVASDVLSYKLTPELEIETSLGYSTLQFNDLQAQRSTFYRPSLNRTTGNTNFSWNNNKTWTVEPKLLYHRRIWKGKLEGLVGLNLHEIKGDGYVLQATGYPDNSLLESLAAAAAVTKTNVFDTKYRYNAIFARLEYNLSDKYVVNLTARRDGSSRFGPDKQFANFGAVGVAWLFSSEKFVNEALPFLSFGKLRGSYGITGSDQVGDYRFMDLYTFTNFNPTYQNTQGLFPGNLFNPDLAWETNRKLEGAIELGFLNDRVFISSSYFRNRSSNQLVSIPLPSITGFAGIDGNLPATVQNTGLEMILTTRNVRTLNFNWTTSANLTVNRNKLIEFPGLAQSTYANRFVIGKTINIRKVYEYRGVNPQTGLYVFKSVTGKDTSNPSFQTDRTALINPDPKFYGGFQNTFSFKNFDVDVFFMFVKQIGFNPLFQGSILPGYFIGSNPLNWPVDILDNHWTKPGDNASVQKFTTNVFGPPQTAYAAAASSDYGYVDASYIRLKNLSVSYRLPDVVLRKAHLKKARFYLQGENLFTITKYKGWDPEPQQTNGRFPPLRVLTFGVQLGL